MAFVVRTNLDINSDHPPFSDCFAQACVKDQRTAVRNARFNNYIRFYAVNHLLDTNHIFRRIIGRPIQLKAKCISDSSLLVPTGVTTFQRLLLLYRSKRFVRPFSSSIKLFSSVSMISFIFLPRRLLDDYKFSFSRQ